MPFKAFVLYMQAKYKTQIKRDSYMMNCLRLIVIGTTQNKEIPTWEDFNREKTEEETKVYSYDEALDDIFGEE